MIDLKRYIDREVLVQFKAPYAYQMARAVDSKPLPLGAIQTSDGKTGLCDAMAPGAQPLMMPILTGTVKERESVLVLVYADPTSNSTMEVAVLPELIAFVTTVAEKARILKVS